MAETPGAPARSAEDELLLLACLFHGSFSVDWIQDLSGQRASAVLRAMAHGVNLGALEGETPDTFRVVDGTLREQVLARVPKESRDSWRRQIVDLVGTAAGDDGVLLEIAHQLMQLPGDIATWRRTLEVGLELNRRFRRSEAQSCFRHIIDDVGNEIDADDSVAGVFVGAVRAHCRYFTGDEDLGWIVGAATRAIECADRVGLHGTGDLLRLNKAQFLWWQGALEEALDQFERSWARLEERDYEVAMRQAVHLRLFFLWQQGRFGEVVATYERHRPALVRHPRSGAPILVTSMLGNCYVWLGQIGTGMGLMHGQYEQCRRLEQPVSMMQVACGLAMAYVDLGQPDRAVEVITRTFAEHREFATPRLTSSSHGILAQAHAALGDPTRALEEWSRVEEGYQGERRRPWLKLLRQLLDAYPDEALPEPILNAIRQQIAAPDTVAASGERGQLSALNGRVLFEQDNKPEEALAYLESAVEQLAESGDLIERAKTQWTLAWALLALDQEGKAREVAQEAAEFLQPINADLIPADLTALLDAHVEDVDLPKEIETLGREVVGIRDYRRLLQRLLARINQLTGAERGALFDVVDGDVVLAGAVALTAEDVASDAFREARAMILRAAQSGQPAFYGRGNADESNEQADRHHHRIRSAFCLPMTLGDSVTGVLYHDNCLLKGHIGEEESCNLQPLAGLAAIALDNARAYEEIRQLNQRLNRERDFYQDELEADQRVEDFIGASSPMRKVFGRIEQVATSSATVLILGETGVGKELVARAIHEASDRSHAPFVRVDCSSLSESLISSEMFGHEKGAFTGALQRRIGRFELADGGTLFLDEIGSLSPEIQAALLRVLETHEFQRVGGNSNVRSDFRLITATNEDLARRVREGSFREDLFYRLNVYPILVPPLREHSEDVPLLAHFFLKRFSAEAGKNISRIDEATINRLEAYGWPGNVRELKNLIERAVLLSKDTYLVLPHFATTSTSDPSRQDMTLAELQRRHILETLGRTGGKIDGPGGAAERLGLHHNTLRSRMKKLGIVRNAASTYVYAEPDRPLTSTRFTGD